MIMITFLSGFGWLTDGKSSGPGAGQAGIIHPTFRWQAANLLAFTKFVGNGLLIKCLPQVDLPAAPLSLLNYPCLPCPRTAALSCWWNADGINEWRLF